MKTTITHKTVWVCCAALAAFFDGCFDVNLLDNMKPMDAGETRSSENETTESGAQAEEDTESFVPIADSDDTEPPIIQPIECGEKERADQRVCIAEGPVSVSLRFVSNEPATVSIEAPSGVVSGAISSSWETLHHAAAANIAGEETTSLKIRLTDINGNETVVTISVCGKGGPAVAITEVLADPFGVEPAQEFVEVVNIGNEPADLSGWMVDDNGDKNGDVIPDSTVLDSGQVAILVSSSYNPSAGEDPPPADNAVIILLEGSIGSSGLKNSEAEPVELYDAALALVSAYDGSAGAPKEGVSSSRLVAELPDGDKAAFAADPSGSSSPGIAPRLQTSAR